MGKLFKIHSINSDGTEVSSEKTFDYIVTGTDGKPLVEDDGRTPSVVITLRPLSHTKWRQVVQSYTTYIPARKGNPPREEIDWDGVNDELIQLVVKEWRGIIGADDKPLACVSEAKLGLPGDLKNDLIERALKGEAVDTAASFRPTA